MKDNIKIFISYTRKDRNIAKKIYDDLKLAGFSPWIDTKDILPGQNWERVIVETIRNSRFFIALLSNDSVTKKGFVQKELKIALDVLDYYPESTAFIIPVRIDECMPVSDKLKSINWVNLFPDYENGLHKIVSAIKTETNMPVLENEVVRKPASLNEHLSYASQEFLYYCRYVAETKHNLNNNLFSKLVTASKSTIEVLNYFGAKSNMKWYSYWELTTIINILCKISFSQKYILNRIIFWDVEDSEDYIRDAERFYQSICGYVRELSVYVIDIAHQLELAIPDQLKDNIETPGLLSADSLPADRHQMLQDNSKRNILKITSRFLKITSTFDSLSFYEPVKKSEFTEYIPHKVNEAFIKRSEILIENLLGVFDIHTIEGGRYGSRAIKKLQSIFSMIYYMLRISGDLLYIYEYHIDLSFNAKKDAISRKKLDDIIDPDTILNFIINYGIYYICRLMQSGKTSAREIINENIERTVIHVAPPIPLGFHSRPSLLIAKIVQYYGGIVELVAEDIRFDASSVLDIQWAGGKIQKENIHQVSFEGDSRAIKDIELLSKNNYGEDRMGKGIPLPAELRYLEST